MRGTHQKKKVRYFPPQHKRHNVLLRLRWKTYKSHAESASADDRVSIYAIVLQIIEL